MVKTRGSPRVEGQFGVENTGFDAKLLQEELEPVAPVNVVDKEDAFAFDKAELEEDIGEEELVRLGAVDVVLRELGRCRSRILLQAKNGLKT